MYNGENWCCDYCGKESETLRHTVVLDSNDDHLDVSLCEDCLRQEGRTFS